MQTATCELKRLPVIFRGFLGKLYPNVVPNGKVVTIQQGSWYLSGVTSVAGCSNSGRSNSGSGVQHFSSRQHITKEVIHIHKVCIMNVSTQVIGTRL